MSAIQRVLLGATALLGVLTVVGLALGVFGLIGSAPVEAQFSNLLGQPEDRELTGIEGPKSDIFCTGDRCAGKTCDEVNDECVGTVTLQPALGQPLVGLSSKQLERFEKGKVAFDTTLTVAAGLGPVFNQDSCGSCHSMPQGGSGTIAVTRFGEITEVDGELVFNPLAESGGSLLNAQAISAACAETIPVPPTNVASQRVTNSTLGFGLVEALPDTDIEINAISPPPGVSGRVHYVPELESPGVTRAGRFGWKAQLATVLSFSADASLQEMGLTTRILQQDNAPNNDQARLAACDTVADPEDVADADGVEFVDRVTDFQRFLAAPPQTPKSGMTGETLFNSMGCANCHMSSFQTPDDSNNLEKALRNKQFHPYSDFLLHDMGNNGDFIAQGGAGLTELRTPPLWGLRVRDPLWHDGRVAGGSFKFRMQQAIAQHNDSDSEAKPSALAFNALPTAQKDQVVAFLNSLGRREFDMNGDGLIDSVDESAVLACVTGPGSFFNADAPCAVADPDQDGDVDQDDLDLLNVALGVVAPPVDDETDDEDEDGDDEDGKGKGKADPEDIETEVATGGSMSLVGDLADPAAPAEVAAEDTAPQPAPAIKRLVPRTNRTTVPAAAPPVSSRTSSRR